LNLQFREQNLVIIEPCLFPILLKNNDLVSKEAALASYQRCPLRNASPVMRATCVPPLLGLTHERGLECRHG
jgi:hypothetical protein